MEIKTGQVLIGTHPDKGWTGQGNIVKALKTSVGFFAYTFIGDRVYRITEHLDYFNEADKKSLETIKDGKTIAQRSEELDQNSFMGFNFGDELPITMPSGREDCIAVFLKKDIKTGDIVISFLRNAESSMPFANKMYSDAEILKMLNFSTENKIRIAYINNEGETIKTSVSSMSEIKDMKELLYKME